MLRSGIPVIFFLGVGEVIDDLRPPNVYCAISARAHSDILRRTMSCT